MRSKILSRRSLIVVILTGSALAAAFLSYGIQQRSNFTNLSVGRETQISSALLQQGQGSSGLPVRLKIPRINVDAAVEYVGLTPDGDMDIPKNQNDVAWYKFGRRPGENGSAVIAGHYGWKDGEPSAFDNLYKLREGDTVYVEDDRGTLTTFVVRENRRYDPDADASDVFRSNDGKPHLNLITCEGEWDEVTQGYSTRLVVFADKE